MLGDALDALESLIAPHAAIPVGRHGGLPHEGEDCGSRIYANKQRLTCLQQRGVPKNRFLSAFMPDRAVPMATNGAREAVSQYSSKPYPLFSAALAQSKWTASPVQDLYSRTLPEARKTVDRRGMLTP
jgi:hypothetical protein